MSSIPSTIRIESPFITGIAKALKIAAESTTAPAQVSNPLRASLRDSAPAAHIMYRDRTILIGDTPDAYSVSFPDCATEYGTLSDLEASIDIYLSFMPC
ncbi:MAG: hypothetical protein JWR14_5764 [Caballeronia sp.]|jgi:hypothetical protein|uniref:hypothetical protein n=1 Tax=Caballeronia sp. TaxID=1931223 RepID=UPI002612277B|nr:hypothetical protein [Caballeronia sp.]MDB5835934.1 hypothetical protein [Caballeronia sp.]